MKELSIEEKAKRYDEAIEKAKGMHKEGMMPERIEYIFPELAESEDEKWIPKEIAKYLKEKGDFRSCWIAWLEKQGEQNLVEYSLEQAAHIFLEALSSTPYNNKPITDAQCITRELLKFLSDASTYNPNALNEWKPVEWNEEDEKMLKGENIPTNAIEYWMPIPLLTKGDYE